MRVPAKYSSSCVCTWSNSSSARSPNGPCTASYLESGSRSADRPPSWATSVIGPSGEGTTVCTTRTSSRSRRSCVTSSWTVMAAIIPPPTDTPARRALSEEKTRDRREM